MTTLAPLSAEHFEIVAQWLSRSDINRWLSGEWRGTKASPTVIAIAVRNRRNRFFLVSNQGEPCGLAALSDIDTADKSAMLWYLLGEQQLSGRGITSDAVKQLVGIAFSELGLQSLFAWAMQSNIPSLKLLTKVGFREVGYMRRASCLEGKQVNRVYFDFIPNDSVSESPLVSA